MAQGVPPWAKVAWLVEETNPLPVMLAGPLELVKPDLITVAVVRAASAWLAS